MVYSTRYVQFNHHRAAPAMESALQHRFMWYACLCLTSVLNTLLREYVLFDSKVRVKQMHVRVKNQKIMHFYADRLVQDDPCMFECLVCHCVQAATLYDRARRGHVLSIQHLRLTTLHFGAKILDAELVQGSLHCKLQFFMALNVCLR
jgi:hypothetical protein